MAVSKQRRASAEESTEQSGRVRERQSARADATVALRRASPGEEQALTELAIRSKAHWGYDDGFVASCAAELAVTPQDILSGLVVVAHREGAILGMAALDLELDPPELAALFVDPPAIRSGVGGLLLADALSRARAAGIQTLQIESDPNAEQFYLSHGASRIGQTRSAATGRLLPLLAIATARQPHTT